MFARRSLALITIVAYLAAMLPTKVFCTERHSNLRDIAQTILQKAESGSSSMLYEPLTELANVFEHSADTVEDGRRFIQSFIEALNAQYGLCLTMETLPAFVLQYKSYFPMTIQETLSAALQWYADASLTYMPSDLDVTLYSKDHYLLCGKKSKKKSRPELELPPKMALGFACVLAGALVFIIPGCQGAGAWMMGAGTTLALDGLSEGERPYYRDPATEEITPF